MAQLAIKGHKTRGKEVIEILEMLGGKNHDRHNGSLEWTYSIDMSRYACYYYIDGDGNIECSHNVGIPLPGIHFTLEEFLEKYPYKVGDKVYNIVQNENQTITKLTWQEDEVIYQTNNNEYVYVNYLQPYKEAPMYLNGKANNLSEEIKKTIEPVKEIMEETDIMNHTTEINLNHPCFKGCNEIEIIIPDGWEFKQRDNKMFGVRKQYPKTYYGCCDILQLDHTFELNYLTIDEENLTDSLIRLMRCRDAYWKIAGEQIGLGKPWEPNWEDETENKYTIVLHGNKNCYANCKGACSFLTFPTVEMRDAFYDNFKDLIEECKEFL